jgi:mannose-6-phosphate isomerase-like protein (cupin superfamily)
MSFTFIKIPESPNYLAPDGSEIRLLASFDRGGLCHCKLPANGISKAVKHKTVEEIWYCLSGNGIIWQRNESGETEREFTAGDSFTIPCGNSFQFRNPGTDPLRVIISTMPRWPGADEATETEGKWKNEAVQKKNNLFKQLFLDAITIAKKAFLMFILMGFLSWILFMLPKNAAEYLFESGSPWILKVAWFVVIIPLVMVFVWLITSDKAIKTDWIKPNIPSYIMVAFSLFCVAGILFSSVAYLLAANQLVTIVPVDGIHSVAISGLLDLFLWQFLEAIPALHINDLLQFTKPFEFDGWVGALVLVFQLSVIFPIINFHKKIKARKK